MMSNQLMVPSRCSERFGNILLDTCVIEVCVCLSVCSAPCLSQWGGGIQSHVCVSWLGKEADGATSEPAATLDARHYGVRLTLVGGQFHRQPGRPDQGPPEPHTGGGESQKAITSFKFSKNNPFSDPKMLWQLFERFG